MTDLKAWRVERLRTLKHTPEYKSLSRRSNARKLVAHMVMKYDAADGTGMFPAPKRLARELKLEASGKTVKRCLHQLVDAGVLIQRPRKKGGGGWDSTNVYWLNPALRTVPPYVSVQELSHPIEPTLTVPPYCPTVVSHHEGSSFRTTTKKLSLREQAEEVLWQDNSKPKIGEKVKTCDAVGEVKDKSSSDQVQVSTLAPQNSNTKHGQVSSVTKEEELEYWRRVYRQSFRAHFGREPEAWNQDNVEWLRQQAENPIPW